MKAKIKKIISVTMTTLLLLTVLPVATASAQLGGSATEGTDDAAASSGQGTCSAGPTFFPRWYDNGLCENGEIKSPGDFGDDTATSFRIWATKLALNIVTILLTVVGYVSLGFIIFGGFKYMTSGDNASGTEAAKKTILNAVIGLVLSILSVSIVTFIAGAIK